MPLRLFRIRGTAVGNGMLLLFGGIAIAMWYFTSLFLQNVLGYSALRAGLGQTPAAVTFVVIARLAATLLPRTGVRPLVLAGSGCFLTGFGWLAQAGAASGYVTSVLGPTLIIAVGIGLTFPTLMAATTADVPEGDTGIVGGLANTAVQVGGAVGLAVLATASSAGAATATATAGSSPAAALAAGYDLVFLMAAGLGLALAVLSVLLPRHRGPGAGVAPDPPEVAAHPVEVGHGGASSAALPALDGSGGALLARPAPAGAGSVGSGTGAVDRRGEFSAPSEPPPGSVAGGTSGRRALGGGPPKARRSPRTSVTSAPGPARTDG